MTRKKGLTANHPGGDPGRGGGVLRIIGGAWRGRRIAFPTDRSIRPTPDRVRETLFNWLQGRVAGRQALDLYAGSGALGLEALSRGAKRVCFVERDPRVSRYLEETLERLGASGGEVVQGEVLRFLARPPSPVDLVFVDPPYAERSLTAVCAALEDGGWLAPGALVYLESAARHGPPELPAGWTLHRSKTAGEVGYHLAARAGPVPPPAAEP